MCRAMALDGTRAIRPARHSESTTRSPADAPASRSRRIDLLPRHPSRSSRLCAPTALPGLEGRPSHRDGMLTDTVANRGPTCSPERPRLTARHRCEASEDPGRRHLRQRPSHAVRHPLKRTIGMLGMPSRPNHRKPVLPAIPRRLDGASSQRPRCVGVTRDSACRHCKRSAHDDELTA